MKVDKMLGNEYEGLSLCIAQNEFTASNKQKIKRLFDVQDLDGRYVLTPFKKDPMAAPWFENRDTLYDNVIHPANEAGIWYWYAEDDKRPEYYGKDFIKNCEKTYTYPIEVIQLPGIKSEQTAITQMKRGIPLNNHLCDKYLFAWETNGHYDGILCEKAMLSLDKDNNLLALNEDTTFVYVYSNFPETDILSLPMEKRAFFRYTDLKDSDCKTVVIRNVETIIKGLFLKYITRKNLQIDGFSRADYQKVKEIIGSIPFHSLVADLVSELKCTQEEARAYIHNAMDQLLSVLDGEDIPDQILMDLIVRNQKLYDTCLAHSTEIFNEQQSKIQKEIEQGHNELGRLYEQIKSAEMDYDIQQKNLEKVRSDIQKEKDFGDEVEKQVATKIENARQHAAEFVSEFVFHTGPQPNPVKEEKSQDHLLYVPGVQAEAGLIKQIDSKDSAVRVLRKNLKMLIDESRTAMSQFLFAAYCYRTPVILAGPGSTSIAEKLAISFTGSTAGKIDCSGKYSSYFLSQLEELPEPILIFNNFLQAGWIEQIPEFLQQTKKYCICTSSMKEPLSFETAGLFNYMVPVFTENIVNPFYLENKTEDHCIYGFCSEETEKVAYELDEGYDDSLRTLGMSVFAAFQNTALFNMAGFYQEEGRKDLYKLGYYPYAYVNNRMDKLREILDEDQSVLEKDEILEYIGL